MADKILGIDIDGEKFDLCLYPQAELSADTVVAERQRFMNQIQSAENQQVQSLVLDLRTHQTIDSQGISLVVGVYKECLRLDLQCTVALVSPLIYKVFQMMQLDKHIRLLRVAAP